MFSIQPDGSLVKLKEHLYENEDIFQQLLQDYPELLSGEQINTSHPRRWLLVNREMGIADSEDSGNRWSVDHLFLDQDAIPTLVEVKRSTDTRIRREVVGQMMDYAANAIAYWPVERLRAQLARRCEEEGVEADSVLREFLGDEDLAAQFWEDVKTNLNAGKVRLLFVADIIPPELHRIIEFLNEQMNPAEVLGVEIKQYVGDNTQTLVPRVIGQTAEAQQKKQSSSPKREWSRASFFAELRECHPTELEKAQRIYQWMEQSPASIVWGGGSQTGSVYITTIAPLKNLFGLVTNGTLWLCLGKLSQPPYDKEAKRIALVERLNEVEGVQIDPAAHSAYPSITLSQVKLEDIDKLLAIFDGAIAELRAV